MKFNEWRKLREARLPPIIRSENKPIGNEEKGSGVLPMRNHAPDPFFQKTRKFMKKIRDEKGGLGELGMKRVGQSTFDREPVKAGGTPTISRGIPVGELRGQF